ncbi:MAG TPA: universal stress protein [Flavobacteriales bacterium]|nr:universal stress protein [Flavobacteriales bacterium]
MSNTILVPTDFSSNAHNALEYAVRLARKSDSKVVLIHAFHIRYLSADIPMQYVAEQLIAVEQEAESLLATLCQKIRSKYHVECSYINKQRLVTELVSDCIRWEDPFLVVMGTKGASGIRKMLIGSNTAKIIEKATCPVLAIPNKVDYRSIKQITYATDYRKGDLQAIKKLVAFATPYKAHITILHVCEDDLSTEVENEDMNMFEDKVRKEILYKDISYQLIYGKYLEKSLDAYVKREAPDVLAMSTHKRTLFQKLFSHSDTKQMAYHTKIPLLAFHE